MAFSISRQSFFHLLQSFRLITGFPALQNCFRIFRKCLYCIKFVIPQPVDISLLFFPTTHTFVINAGTYKNNLFFCIPLALIFASISSLSLGEIRKLIVGYLCTPLIATPLHWQFPTSLPILLVYWDTNVSMCSR